LPTCNNRKVLGLRRGTVRVVSHQNSWKASFEEEAARLRDELGADLLKVEHVGSTSIPGLDAKPILDIVIAVESLRKVAALTPGLENLGYIRRPNGDTPTRLFFAKGPEASRTHHLSVTELDSDTWTEQVAFRDYLMANEEVRDEYRALKRRLARLHPYDRPAYTAKKADFIQQVLTLIPAAGNSEHRRT
jgi:GrpB-like predicted nucleotidyltransferase (UPF0157 family)